MKVFCSSLKIIKCIENKTGPDWLNMYTQVKLKELSKGLKGFGCSHCYSKLCRLPFALSLPWVSGC